MKSDGGVQTITFYALRSLNPTYTNCMFPLPTIFVLRNSQIHICTSNCSNVATNIKAPVNEIFGFGTALNVPNVNSNDGYIRFRENFDNSWF